MRVRGAITDGKAGISRSLAGTAPHRSTTRKDRTAQIPKLTVRAPLSASAGDQHAAGKNSGGDHNRRAQAIKENPVGERPGEADGDLARLANSGQSSHGGT